MTAEAGHQGSVQSRRALERLPSNRMRQYVRAWITEWDIRHIDPSYQPDLVASEVVMDFTEDNDLDPGPDGAGSPGGGEEAAAT